MAPIELMTFNYQIRHFGQMINEKKHKMRGGYKKRGRKEGNINEKHTGNT